MTDYKALFDLAWVVILGLLGIVYRLVNSRITENKRSISQLNKKLEDELRVLDTSVAKALTDMQEHVNKKADDSELTRLRDTVDGLSGRLDVMNSVLGELKGMLRVFIDRPRSTDRM